ATDRIVVHALNSALATVAIVAEKLQKPIHVHRGLVERNFGSFCGRVIHEVKRQHGLRPDESSRDILPPDADPFHEIFERIPPVVAKWMNSHPNELLLFVGHSGVFDALHHHLLGPRSGRESSFAIPYRANPSDKGWELRPVADAWGEREPDDHPSGSERRSPTVAGALSAGDVGRKSGCHAHAP